MESAQYASGNMSSRHVLKDLEVNVSSVEGNDSLLITLKMRNGDGDKFEVLQECSFKQDGEIVVTTKQRPLSRSDDSSLDWTSMKSDADDDATGRTNVLSNNNAPMRVLLKTLTGKRHLVVVCPSDTVGQVKSMSQSEIGVPDYQMRYIFNGKYLQDDLTLASCGIKNGSTIQLVIQFCGPPRVQ